MAKTRLDIVLTQKGLAENRNKARALIMAGKVTVDGRIVSKAGTQIAHDARITIKNDLPYVSRGGLKLAAALDAFQIDPGQAICADVGASTGGFTDVLLQHGAARVYAIDVGYGQLAWKLRQDERVIVQERTNARYLESLPEKVDLVTIDVSFISIKLILPRVAQWLRPSGVVVSLVKPQFEAGKEQVGKGGIVRDKAVHRDVLRRAAAYAAQAGLTVCGLIPSPITGSAGNHEFLIYLAQQQKEPSLDIEQAIERCLANIEL